MSRIVQVVVAVAAALAVGAVVWWLQRPAEDVAPPRPRSFAGGAVEVASPVLEIAIDGVRSEVRDGYAELGVDVRCLEPDGCHAEVLLHLVLDPGAFPAILEGRVDVASGEVVRLSRVLRPAPVVERVADARLELVRPLVPGAPTPPEYDYD